ncbi:MAG TPA: serine/threonine-protein kinase, partial [Pirellulaceae bacterium]|nr:serine/threonine-protein kinase [Pirellulaceae bacterium]
LHLGDDTAIVRLGREMAAAGRVEHEHIVYTSDAGTQDGIDYLVMELVEGVDLARLVAECGPLPIADACEIVRQAALGLAHIESCGLVHRDIKPSNLMLSLQGIVKILDLGLARLRERPIDEEEATHTGFLLGTADYISPEQIDTPRQADVRSDLYSLGCTLFKLLTGRAPFSDEDHLSATRKIDAHRREPPPSVRSLRPEVAFELDQLLLRLLAKEPKDRPPTAIGVAEKLTGFTSGAELRKLAQQALPALPAEVLPRAEMGHTPPSPSGSTRPLDSAPTPRAATLPGARRRFFRLAAGGGALAVGLLAVAVAASGWLNPPSDRGVPIVTRDGLADGGQAVAGSGVTTFDLRQPPKELKWEGHVSSPPPFFNENQQMLEVRPDSFQLLAIGKYDGHPGAFEVTIRQSPWHGDAGLFFGYRHEPQPGYKQLAMFQLVRVWHYPLANATGKTVSSEMQVVRERGIIWLNPLHLREEARERKLVTYPKSSDVRLRVEFDELGLKRIALDGVELPELSAPATNAKYTAADYQGVFGLYAAVSEIDMGPTWFSNFVFIPSEPSP